MGKGGFPKRLVVGILVALFFGVALYLRIVLPYDQIFVGEWIKFAGTDVYHFMRLVDNLTHNFPHFISFDPYMHFPNGQSPGNLNFFVYLLSGITWLIGLGAPTQYTIDIVGVYFPPVLGALTVIPVYFIGKALFNRWAGVIAAGLFAILPGEFLGRSILGFTDRDALEVMFTALTMLFLILAIRSARQEELAFSLKRWDRTTITKPLVYSLLTGVFLGFYLLTWKGAFLFVLIILAYFIIQSIIDHLKHKNINYLGLIGTITFLVALIIFLPSHPRQVYLATMIIAVLTPPLLATVSLLMMKTKVKVGYYPLAMFGLGLIGLATIYIVNPSILKSILNQFQIFVPSEIKTTIIETEPILFPGGHFTLRLVWLNFTTGFFLSLIALGILIYQVVKRGEAYKTLIIIWSLVILVATLALRRMALLYVLNVALLTGYLSWLALQFAGFKEAAGEPIETPKKSEVQKIMRKRRPHLAARRANMALGVLAVFFVAFFLNINPAINTSSQARYAPSNAWCESLSWLKDNTPDPFDDPDFYHDLYTKPFHYPETAYGVVAWWDVGYWIVRIGHRPSNCDPGGGTAARQQVAKFFTARDEASANTLINKLKSRYVIIDYTTAVVARSGYNLLGKFHSLAGYAGASGEEFYEIYYQLKDGRPEPVLLFYPEYYRSLIVRLYNFDGAQVVPSESTVISYDDRTISDGTPYKVITSIKSFPSYSAAENYMASQKSGNYRIVSPHPFTSPVPLESLGHYKLVYSSQDYTGDNVPEVKIFEYIR